MSTDVLGFNAILSAVKQFALWIWLAAVLGAAPLPRNYAVEHYDASLTPDPAKQRIAGEVAIRFHSRIDVLSGLELDAGGMEISSVTEGGAPQYFERKGKLLIVALAKPAGAGEPRTIVIQYTAVPAKGLVFAPGQVYTSFFTSDWLVSNDRPDEPSTLRLRIKAPAEWKVAASGESSAANEWRIEKPAPPFLYAFAMGEFTENVVEKEGVKLRILGPPSLPVAAIADATGKALGFIAGRTGARYPGGVYTQAFLNGEVKQEAVGMTLLPASYGEGLAKAPEDLWLLGHELAHQWFGVGIQCADWSDFWLNEGMATFIADAWLGQLFGKARYEREIESARKTYERLAAEGRDRPLSFSEWQTPAQAGGSLPYYKGAWVLDLLRRQLGDEVFWRGLRRYTSEHWGGPVTSDDFERSMSAASRKDLTKFFDRWVTGCCSK